MLIIKCVNNSCQERRNYKGKVNLVNGVIDSSELGRTLMHEHFLFGYCGFQGDGTLGGFNEEEAIQANLQMIEDARAYGVQTIVDATTNECGRDVRYLKKIADMTGFNIICSTGYYFQAESSFAYWEFRKSFYDIQQEIFEMMATELTKGIEGTDVKAGVIKLATSFNEITPMEETFFKAAAKAQKETGCVIITHTQLGTMGPEQADLLISEGADPKKIAIGHMCGSTDIAYHEEVLKRGVYVNLDRFGYEGELLHTPTDEERMDVVKTLCDKGYKDKIMLSHDSVNILLGRQPMTPIMLEILKYANVRNMNERIIPGLKKRGLTDADIDIILTKNPASIFA